MLRVAIDPTTLDVWSDPRASRGKGVLGIALVAFLALGVVSELRHPYEGGYGWMLPFASTVIGVVIAYRTIAFLRQAARPATLLFGVRPDGVLVMANGSSVLVPWHLVEGAQVRSRKDGVFSVVTLLPDAPRIMNGAGLLGHSFAVPMEPGTGDARAYTDWVNARAGSPASTPNIRATSAS